MKIYRRVYDSDKYEDGTEKENEFLGEFELLDGDMNDYSYQVIVKNEAGELFILYGKEVSDFYCPNMGGTRHSLEPLKENYFVKKYLEFSSQNNNKETNKN